MTTGLFLRGFPAPPRRPTPPERVPRRRELVEEPPRRLPEVDWEKLPEYLSPEQAKEAFDVDLQPGWQLRIKRTTLGVDVRYITPDKWEILEGGKYFFSPEGKFYSAKELERERLEIAPPVFPEEEITSMLRAMEIREGATFEEIDAAIVAQDEFMATLRAQGRTPETEALLRQIGATEEQMVELFAPREAPLEEVLARVFPERDIAETVNWAIEDRDAFHEAIEEMGRTEDTTALLKATYPGITEDEIISFFAEPTKPVSNKFLDGITTGLQYVEGWWKTGLMEAGFGLYKGLEIIFRRENRWTSEAEKIMDSAYAKHGWKAIFSDEVNEAWDVYFQERFGGTPAAIVAELSNPIWWTGVGGLAGLLAKPFSKIPLLGKTLGGAAKTVRAAEEVALFPLTAPLKGGLRFAGRAVGVRPTRPFLTDVLPTASEIKATLFKSDTFRRVAGRVPGMKWLAPGTVIEGKLPITLITKPEVEGAVVQEILSRTAILELGQGTKGQALAYIRELGTTRGILRVKDGICSARWVKPRFAGESLALGDVIQAPERYIFKHRSGLEYCKRSQQICREMYELATKEGIEIHRVGLEPFEEYVHWVCIGKIGKDGVLQMGRRGTRAVGGIVGAMKTRRFESMMDGIKAGYKYGDDLEVYVASYVDDMFRAIGDKRLGDGLAEVIPKVEGMLPVKPLDRLIALYPEREIAWTGIRKEMADLGYVWSAVKRAGRGEVLPVATIRALERRSPEYAAKLAKIVPERVPDTLPLKQVLGYETRFPLGKLEVAEPKLLERLTRKIKSEGLREPITIRVREDGSLIVWDGMHRLIAARRLGIKNLPIKFIGDIGKLARPPAVALDKKALRALSKELKTKIETLKPDWWKTRYERSTAMEIVRKPILGREEGVIRTATGYAHPMFQNQIYPRTIADQATKLLNEEAATFFRATAGISAAFRMQIAVLDISAWCIQGLMAQFSHPIRAMRANVAMIEALIKPKIFQQYLVKIAPSMNERIYYLGAQRPFEFFESMGWFVKMAGKVPGGKAVIGQTFGRAQASFSMWSTVYKDLMWQANAKHWIKAGQGAEFARYLDRMTGMMSFSQLGMPANARAFLAGWVSFAPQYRFSVLSWFTHLFKGGMIGAEARKDLAKMVAGAAISYTAFCKVTNNPVYLNPYKDGKKFMSINVDGRWIGIGAAVVSMIRAFADITASALSIDANEPMDFLTLDKWKNPLIRLWFMQSAVLPSMISEIVQRRDFLGYPLESPEDWASWAGEQITPIWLQDIFFDRTGVPITPLGVLGEFAGLRTSPQTRWETLNDKLVSLKAWEVVTDLTDEQREKIEAGETVLSVLDRFQKTEMFNAFPELIELYEEAIADALNRSSQIRKNYETATLSVREEAVDSLTGAMDVGVKLDGEDTRWLRERYGETMQIYGAKNDILRDVEEYQDMFDEWDEAREKRMPEAELVDLAYWEYIEDVVSPDYTLPNGDFDFEAYDQALVDFKDKWGEDIYDKIVYILENNKADFPDWAIKLWKDRLTLNKGKYWKLPYKPIYQMDKDDEAEGNIPEEYYPLWKEYQALPDVDKEAFLERHPEFSKDWREEFRFANPEADAMLALWDYGGKLQSKEAYNLVEKWAGELGIPLEQIGLGLPPRTFIDAYFELNKIVAETGGSSVEAKLFKLEHPEYLAWGLEQGIWKDDLSGEIIEALKLRVKHRDSFAEYEAIVESREREKYLDTHTEFRDDRRRIEAYGLKFPVTEIESYVEYYSLPVTGFRQERYLLEHPEFADAMHNIKGIDLPKPQDVPLVQYDEIYERWQSDFDKLEGLGDFQSKYYIEDTVERDRVRDRMRRDAKGNLTEFGRAEIERRAYGEFFPVDLIDTYVDWYAVKRPGYEDDWYLQEHKDFYKAMVSKGILQKRDFSRVPSRRVDQLLKIYKGLPLGQTRLDFRAQNPDLEWWLVNMEGYKPVADRGDKDADLSRWERLAEELLSLEERLRRLRE